MQSSRRSWSAAWIGLLCWATVSFAGDFETANQKYDQGQFAEAKQGYEHLVATGPWSANLFFNLGNAEFRLGSSGRAALQYERTLNLEPGHREAARNLVVVRNQSGAKGIEQPWFETLLPPFSTDCLTIAVTVSCWLALALLIALFVRKTHRTALGSALALCMFLALYSAAGLWRQHRDRSLAIIVGKDVEARLAPADRAALAEALPQGSRVRILSERGDWIYCVLPNGLGWIPAKGLEKISLDHP